MESVRQFDGNEAHSLKIAISDFDGTMYFVKNKPGFEVPEINRTAMQKWHEAGNLFVFCTGRDLRSLMHELGRQNLCYDYIICNNGGTLFDKDMKLVRDFQLDKEELAKLVHSDLAAKSYHLLYSSADKMRVTINSPKSVLRAYFELEKYKGQNFIKMISPDEALQEMNTVQVSLCYADETEARKYAAYIEAHFNGTFTVNLNQNYLDICCRGVNKAAGIKMLSQREGWQAQDIMTIGDSQNDIPMIKAYHGYSLYSATADAKAAASKLYDSVGAMLLDNI